MHDEPTTAAGQWYGALEKTVRREVLEETGIEIEKPHYLLDLTFILPNGIPVLVISYYAKYKSGDVVLDEDTINHAWVTADEAKTYDMIEGIAEEIEMVHEILNK
jgi:NADH pyrophosphatase NudC (nudix superfamily)